MSKKKGMSADLMGVRVVRERACVVRVAKVAVGCGEDAALQTA
jgi:hypothetical protein